MNATRDASACRLSDADVSAIREVDKGYVTGVISRDWEAITALLTPDAVMMPPNEPAVAGRAANLTRFRTFSFDSVEYAHTPVDIQGDGFLAYLRGSYSLRMTFGGKSEPFVDKGKYLWVLAKQGSGQWLIDRIMWNTDGPGSAT